MPISPKETVTSQLSLLARAHAITLEQVDLAKDIVSTRFAGLSPEAQCLVAASITQSLATNYLAEIRKAIK